MRVLVCPDSFKGTLTAVEATAAIGAGLRSVIPDLVMVELPLADGGEGTLEVAFAAGGGKWVTASACDPLGRPLDAQYLVLPDGKTVLIEMARVAGLDLLGKRERDPGRATTHGVGHLVAHALNAGYRELAIGLGGSATNDGGSGMAQALGVRFLDRQGRPLPHISGETLPAVGRIDTSRSHPGLHQARIVALTDVANPLTGPEGAAARYGPQKGADPGAVQHLEAGLQHLLRVARDEGLVQGEHPGDGAAGGLGFGLRAFCRAERIAGFDWLADRVKFNQALTGVDLVVTGEGQFDGQTPAGKVVAGVAGRAAAQGRPVAVLAGRLGPGAAAAREQLGLSWLAACGSEGGSAGERLRALAGRLGAQLKEGRGIG